MLLLQTSKIIMVSIKNPKKKMFYTHEFFPSKILFKYMQMGSYFEAFIVKNTMVQPKFNLDNGLVNCHLNLKMLAHIF